MSASQARGGPRGILYISYDGMLEPLGQGQVVTYLEKLAVGRRIHLMSFEKADDWADGPRREAMHARLRLAGIEWHPRRYHKRPSAPATAYDIAAGAARAVALVRRHRLNIVHARSYVAAAMALAVKKAFGTAFLFDMRGFWADERVDGGLWPAEGPLYRAAKAMERRFLLAADQVVTLTHASQAEIRGFDFLSGRAADRRHSNLRRSRPLHHPGGGAGRVVRPWLCRLGRLVPCGDADALARAIDEALKEPPKPKEMRARADQVAGRAMIERYSELLI